MAPATSNNKQTTDEAKRHTVELIELHFADLRISKWAPKDRSSLGRTIAGVTKSGPAAQNLSAPGKPATGLTASRWAPKETIARGTTTTAGLDYGGPAAKNTSASDKTTTNPATDKYTFTPAPTKFTAGPAANIWAPRNISGSNRPAGTPAVSSPAPLSTHASESAFKGISASKLALEDKSAPEKITLRLNPNIPAPHMKRVAKQKVNNAAHPSETDSTVVDGGSDDMPAEHRGTRTRARAWATICFGDRKAILGEKKFATVWIMGQLQAFGMTRTEWTTQLVNEEVDRAERIANATETEITMPALEGSWAEDVELEESRNTYDSSSSKCSSSGGAESDSEDGETISTTATSTPASTNALAPPRLVPRADTQINMPVHCESIGSSVSQNIREPTELLRRIAELERVVYRRLAKNQ